MSKMKPYIFSFIIFSLFLSLSFAAECGKQAGGAICLNGLCCSKYGYCGDNELYCELPECQSNCWPDVSGNLSDTISKAQFEDMLLHRNNYLCPAKGFYTYDAFITAAKSFPDFGTTGDTAARKKEVAAFFGQTSHETTGRAPDGPYSWGYCYKEQLDPPSTYCDQRQSYTWPCAYNASYYGRGPMQLLWNYNYGQCGRDIGVDLLSNPNIVANDAVIAFKTAIWFWMTPQYPKPSCHAVITDQWQPSYADRAAGRLPGYGLLTNIINGGYECGIDQDPNVKDRINYYETYCNMFGVDPGENLDCYKQQPFGYNVLLDAAS
ncbi:hypothetical protein CARUB_v10020662mg [Capsella rubella]|uniref:chitinase n=1 Tax=Capsella rubella TaxID=81985 RepID=R0IA58_9BRAS|nr:basic endochitinase B [Capsella rubella]EOA33438.1 hypothetical protein CARUB_v10020662mg [Capsella rubella]